MTLLELKTSTPTGILRSPILIAASVMGACCSCELVRSKLKVTMSFFVRSDSTSMVMLMLLSLADHELPEANKF